MNREERLKKISMIMDGLEGHHGIRLLIPDLEVSENLKYHINNNIKLASNVFRIHSKSYLDLFNEARVLWKSGSLEVCDADAWLLQTDIGKTAMINGVEVPLDLPMEVDDDELKWHQDLKDRKVTVIEDGGWSFQIENSLPVKLSNAEQLSIPKFVWHRVIKGKGNLIVEIVES